MSLKISKCFKGKIKSDLTNYRLFSPMPINQISNAGKWVDEFKGKITLFR